MRKQVKNQKKKIMEYMFHVSETSDVPIFFTTGMVAKALEIPHPSCRRVFAEFLEKKIIEQAGEITALFKAPTEEQMFLFLKKYNSEGRKVYIRNKVLT